MFINVKGKVMQVDANKDREGQNVGVGSKQGTRNQNWAIVYTDQEDPMKKKTEEEFGFKFGRPFYIVTQMCSGRAIRVNGRNLVLSRKTNSSSMQFFFDQKSRTIKSWSNKERSIDIQSSGASSNLQIWNTNSQWWQTFRFLGENLVSSRGRVVDVAGGVDNENSNIIVASKNNKMSQRWTIIYVDEDKPAPKKGQFV